MSSWICYEDYLDTATRTASSGNSLFPASNLYDQSIRGRVWRSSGYFNITSANKGIVFNVGAGDATANIAEAEYTSMSSFLAAVVTALNAAHAGTYTATQDSSTKKIVLTRSTGTFTIKWSDVGSTAADVLGFDTGGDDTGSLSYTADYIRNHTEEFLKWDLGASSNPKAFFAVGKKNAAIKISSGATIKLQGNSTDNFSSPEYEETLAYDELAIIALSETGLHTSALRYWRLSIVDRDNANGYVELSNVYLGDAYIPTRGRIQFPLNISSVDFSSETQFQSGAKAFTRRQRSEQFSFGWFPLTSIEKEVFDEISRTLGVSKPFYIVFDPDLVYGSTINYNSRFVRFNNDMGLSFDNPNIWSSDWSLEEML